MPLSYCITNKSFCKRFVVKELLNFVIYGLCLLYCYEYRGNKIIMTRQR